MEISNKDGNKEKFFIFSNSNPSSSDKKLFNSQIKLNSSEDDINTTSDKKIKNFVIIQFKKNRNNS